MAGITYRVCGIESDLDSVVDAIQANTHTTHEALRGSIAAVNTYLGQMSAVATVNSELLTLIRTYGLPTIAAFRTAVGLPEYPSDQNSRAYWLLTRTGIACIHGMYVCTQHTRAVSVNPYRKLYSAIGLSTMEATLGNASPRGFEYYVALNGVILTGQSPLAVMQSSGVAFSDLAITFVWFVEPNAHAKITLTQSGFPGDVVYYLLRGVSTRNVTTVVIPRLDFCSKLRTMGYTDSDMRTLLAESSSINKVLIDSQQTRADDALTEVSGVYQSFPYPGELARALAQQITDAPTSQELAISGMDLYLPPSVALLAAISPSRSFPTQAYITALAAKASTENAGSQAILSVLTTGLSEIFDTWDALAGIATPALGAIVAVCENIRAFLLGDNYGRSNPAAWPYMTTLDPDTMEIVEDTLADNFGIACAQMDLTFSLIYSLVSGVSVAVTQLIDFDGIAEKTTGMDLSGDGGGYDEDGAILAALSDLSDVLTTLQQVLDMVAADLGALSQTLVSVANEIQQRRVTAPNSTTIQLTQALTAQLFRSFPP